VFQQVLAIRRSLATRGVQKIHKHIEFSTDYIVWRLCALRRIGNDNCNFCYSVYMRVPPRILICKNGDNISCSRLGNVDCHKPFNTQRAAGQAG
jgi:hypothetical protein